MNCSPTKRAASCIASSLVSRTPSIREIRLGLSCTTRVLQLSIIRMLNVIVTGAAGFIGSHTCDQLLAGSCRVIGIDNFRTGRRENLLDALPHAKFVFREADVAEPGIMDELVAEFSPFAIVHLAALVSVPESLAMPDLNFRLNVQATHLVAEAARKGRVPRIVFSSSAAVYGETFGQPLIEASCPCHPVSPYGAAKLASEDLLLCYARAYGLTALCLRYFNVFGPRQDPASPYSGVISVFARCFWEGRPITIYGDGLQSRDFISVHDVARANVLAATKPDFPSAAINICTGRQTTLLLLLDILARHFSKPKRAEFAPPRLGDIKHSVGDPGTAKSILAFEPAWTVEAGLKELVSGCTIKNAPQVRPG